MNKTLINIKTLIPSLYRYNKYSISIGSSYTRKMATVPNVPKVDIDPSGVFKYILINVYDKTVNEAEPQMVIVRGYKRCDYHSDIFDEVQAKLSPLDCEPLGGGRISHDAENKKIHIYGYSQGYGKADHEETAKIIKEFYPKYTLSVSDEGDPSCSCDTS